MSIKEEIQKREDFRRKKETIEGVPLYIREKLKTQVHYKLFY